MTWIILTFLSLAGVLISEGMEKKKPEWILKPLASVGFIGLAWSQGALESTFGTTVMVALVLSWLGDVFLIPRTKGPFLIGLVAFLLGHVAFVWAFIGAGPDPTLVGVAMVALTLCSALVCRWLLPKTPEGLRIPVMAYVGVITVMVAMAAGLWNMPYGPHLLAAALFFYGSDLSVAINRFVSPRFVHRLWGLPAYYIAQLSFAYLVAYPF